jgi:site-specific recombinase XerD
MIALNFPVLFRYSQNPMKKRIDTVQARDKLPARRHPYWQRLSTGCSVGFRKMAAGSSGTWLAWIYDPAAGKDTTRSLGGFEDLQPHERFSAAKRAAEELAEHLGQGGATDTMTVTQAGRAYVEHLIAEDNIKNAEDVAARFKRWVDGDKIGTMDLRKLTLHHVRVWRQNLIKRPVVVNPYADEANRMTRTRALSTVNRDMAALRAALNFALESGVAMSDAAWRMPLKPIANADRRRSLYLDRTQRTALIQAAPEDLGLFLKGLALVPLRPGALASLTAGSFDNRLSVLTIGKDKAGADRTLKLPPATSKFFAERCADKLPGAPLFARADGVAWGKDAWKKPVKAAAMDAGLPEATTAYTLRHSVITDLVVAGLDVLTVARLSGTSIAMIERHYGHLRADHAAAALATLSV